MTAEVKDKQPCARCQTPKRPYDLWQFKINKRVIMVCHECYHELKAQEIPGEKPLDTGKKK